MKNRLTLFLTLGILGIPILLLALNIPGLVSPSQTSYPLSLSVEWLYATAGFLILTAAFSTVVWFMLVRDAGDKIPPSVMLAIGVIGFITYTLHLLGAIPFFPISRVVISPETIFLSWLYITFGVAGLLTKRQAS
jgi:hypothetical protein